jgi:urea transporter
MVMAGRLEGRATATRWSAEGARSYGQVFFAHSPWVGLLFVLAAATEPPTLGFGLLAVLVAAAVARLLQLDPELRASGAFGYNALLVGAGVGHLYVGSWLAIAVTIVAAALSVALTGALKAWLTRHLALPVLSLPFLAVFWLLSSAAPDLGLDLAPWFVQPVAPASPIPAILSGYAQCLGSIFFLPSSQAGALVALALFVHSRIAWLLSLGAFLLLCGFNAVLPAPLPAPAFAGLAANAMLLAIAIGGVWFVPSRWSVFAAIAATTACVLIGAGLYRPLERLGLPILFLPFNLAAFTFLLVARERIRDDRPRSVDFLPGSPEENLSYVLDQRARFPLSHGVRFHLPFRGRWSCTQGINGKHTHQGPWKHAFDFQIVGDDGNLYSGSPHSVTDYHCHKLPALAAAAGVVVKIEDDIPDNPIGEVNLVHNWGNVVMVQHGPGLYSLVAHLARRSIKVKEGQHVARGELLGLCGNSGRSPTPHIHFHLQNTAHLGAETLPVSFCDVVMAAAIGERLELSHAPEEGDVCRNLEPSHEPVARLLPRPGDTWRMRGAGGVEEVRTDLDLLGQLRLQSDRASRLVCTRTEDLLLVHNPVGNDRSVLSLLRAALPRIPLEDNGALVWKDYVPAHRSLGLFAGRSAGLAARLFPRPGLAMSYTLHRDATRVVIQGTSFRKTRDGQPLLRTHIVFDAEMGPVSIQLLHGRGEQRALRVPSEAHLANSSGPALHRSGEPSTPSAPAPDRQEDHLN